MAIRELTFTKGNVRAQDDALIYNSWMKTGIYLDILNELSASAAGTIVTVKDGYLNVQGRSLSNNADVEIITDALTGEGYIIIKIDLSQPDGLQVTMEHTQDVAFPALVQQDLNNGGTIYEFPIYSYTTDGANVVLTDIRLYQTRVDVIIEDFELLSGTWALISDGGDPYDTYYEYIISDDSIIPSDSITVWPSEISDVDGTYGGAGFAVVNYASLGELRLVAKNLPTESIFIVYRTNRGVNNG